MHPRRPPLSKQPTPQQTRKDRRAAERRDRFEAARDQRRVRASARSGGNPGGLSTTTLVTIGAVVVGLVIIGIVAAGQLGGKVSGTLRDPGTAYPAAIVDGTNLGRADAPVTLEVYEDYQCPFCANYSLTVEPVVVSQYVNQGTLRIVHHDIAILGRGGADDESKVAASGAVCADAQGKYWSYAHWAYNNQDGENAGGFSRDRLTAIAEAAGLDGAAFRTCVDDAATVQEVVQVTTAARALGINSTPTLYLNGTKLESAASQSAQVLGAAVEKAAASAAPSAPASAAPSASAAP